ncbi:MAG: tetratricopeptide repeat protein [Cyanobacteria bacterium SZAS LIN-5]|nr:tetratricopeptide repeat protein [Cyanobacteria bacterium SZAS LIN-5]
MMVRSKLRPLITGIFLAISVGAHASGQTPFQPDNQAIQLYNDGVALVQAHDLQNAESKFRDAISISPKFADAHSNLGTVLVQQGKYDDAMAELQKATQLKPTSPPAWGTLATCYQSLGRTEDAIAAFKTFLQLSPDAPEAAQVRSGIAMLENELKRTGGAKAVAQNPNDYFEDATQNGIARWPQSRLPITVSIKPDPNVPGFRQEYVDVLKQAFTDWEEASQGAIKFQFTDDPSAKIVCTWTDDTKQMISSAEGGHAVVVPDSKGILKVNIILLSVPPLGTQKLSANYARRIDLHEIGHGLGILGHSKTPGDIMFSTVMPADTVPQLSNRDKATLAKIYSASAEMLSSHPLNMNKMMMSGDPNSNVNQLLRLNAEAADAMKQGKIALSVQKLEAAQKLDPNSEIVNHNLGSAYANSGMMAAAVHNWSSAEAYFLRAIPLLNKDADKTNLVQVLKAYSTVLKLSGRPADAAKIDGKLKSLPGAGK